MLSCTANVVVPHVVVLDFCLYVKACQNSWGFASWVDVGRCFPIFPNRSSICRTRARFLVAIGFGSLLLIGDACVCTRRQRDMYSALTSPNKWIFHHESGRSWWSWSWWWWWWWWWWWIWIWKLIWKWLWWQWWRRWYWWLMVDDDDDDDDFDDRWKTI